MKVHELLTELSYPGNIGMQEMFQFYSVASDADKAKMKSLLDSKQFKKAWEFLQKTLGVKLK